MTQPTFIESPYVYKEIGYNFEQEIRFVLGVNPDLSWQKPNLPGIIIELDFMKLLDWSSLFATRIELSREQNSFTMSDEPEGLFPDLD
ncbi:MAG TPA: hypothetical protein VN952_03550 [Chthoniobacterales bacterium]|nr:hypothetical protein [Chthoniobacterales bacterium]